VPEACVWGQLTDQEKTTVIAAMARLIFGARENLPASAFQN
jgi:hypothetical protein